MRRVTVLLIAAVAGCGEDVPPPVEVSSGRLVAVIESAPARIRLLLDGDEVWATSPHGFGDHGRVQAEIEMLYGSFKFEERDQPSTAIDRFADVTPTATGATFAVRAGDTTVGTGELTFVPETRSGADPDAAGHPRHVRIRIAVADAQRIALDATCDPDEHFIGLGGQSWDVDHRGHTVPLWVQEDGITKSDGADDEYLGAWFLTGRRHSTHTPMPMLVSSRGHAVAVDTPARAVFALCTDDAADVARFEAWDSELDVQLVIGAGDRTGDRGDAIRDALGHLVAWTGKPPRPPKFAFAPWLDAIFGEDNVRRVAERLRAEGIAASAIWTEDWRGGAPGAFGYALDEDWRVDRALYPNIEALADDLHDLGYKFLTYHNSFVDTEGDIYAEAIAGGYTVRDYQDMPYHFDGVAFHPTALLDLSNPAAVTWAKAVIGEGFPLGADGWMADFAEWLPADARLASGEHPMRAHNLYPVEWARLNRDLLAAQQQIDGVERLFFVRAAWLGSQPLVSVVWMGDQQTDFSDGDGMPSVIPMMIGLGVTGFPYVGHDIAGYMSQFTVPTTEEVFYRWVTLGALSPVMRTHHGRDAMLNYQWENDAGSIAHVRRWTRFHMQLVPYLWGSIGAFERDGLPLVRTLALAYPGEPWAWTTIDQFMLGDRVIVAPVVEAGATSRSVQLPQGRWFPIAGGAGRDGGNFIVTVPVDDIAVFVPAGAMLVLYPDGVDTVVDATAPGVVTAADVAGDREVWLYPGTPSGDLGRWNDDDGVVGAAHWTWSGRDEALGPATSAMFDGSPVAPVTVPAGVAFDVVGDGTLAVDGGGTLVISRGLPTAAVRVVVR